jgi:hypothetical protein
MNWYIPPPWRTKMRGLAFRRHQLDRLRKKRKRYYGGWAGESKRNEGIVLSTPKLCSQPCCGNPRKWFGERTRQETAEDAAYAILAKDWNTPEEDEAWKDL